MATATRPDDGGAFEIELADDFVLTNTTPITSATFTGLLPAGATAVRRSSSKSTGCFRRISDVGRTSGPPTFSTPQVPTRVNSPSDVAFDSRDFEASGLTFSTTVVDHQFHRSSTRCSPAASIPYRAISTGGNGAGHGRGGPVRRDLHHALPPPRRPLFLRAPGPAGQTAISFGCRRRNRSCPPGTPFPPGFTDLQSWTRDAAIARPRLAARRHGHRRPAPGGPDIQRGVLAHRQPGSRAFDLGHDAARLRRPRFRRLAPHQKGPPRERMSHPKAAEAAFERRARSSPPPAPRPR